MTPVSASRIRGLPPIVCAVDDGYALPLRALMESIAAAHRRCLEGLRLIVLHHRLAAVGQDLLLRHADALGLPIQLRAVPAPNHLYPVSGWVSDAVYLRLSIGEVLPDERAALYIDADTVVLGDLRPLLSTDLGGAPLGAVRDPQNPLLGRGIALPGWRTLGLPEEREYFNSGVMLLDLGQCHRRDLFGRASRFLVEHPDCMRFWDQDALNWAAADSWARLARCWNTFALSPLAAQPGFIHYAEPVMPLETLLADEATAVVMHFAGPDKPWAESYPSGPVRDAYRRFMVATNDGRTP